MARKKPTTEDFMNLLNSLYKKSLDGIPHVSPPIEEFALVVSSAGSLLICLKSNFVAPAIARLHSHCNGSVHSSDFAFDSIFFPD